MELTQAEGSEVQHRGTVAAGVDDVVLVLQHQAAAFRQRTEPLVFIGAQLLTLTLGKETRGHKPQLPVSLFRIVTSFIDLVPSLMDFFINFKEK